MVCINTFFEEESEDWSRELVVEPPVAILLTADYRIPSYLSQSGDAAFSGPS